MLQYCIFLCALNGCFYVRVGMYVCSCAWLQRVTHFSKNLRSSSRF